MNRVLSLFVVSLLAPGCIAIDDFSKFAEGMDAGAIADAGEAVDTGADPIDAGPGPDDTGLPASDAGPDASGCVAEICNGADDDCDGVTDEDPLPCALPNADATCSAGACEVVTCTGTFLDCTDEPGCETDPASDAAHCGACETACSIGQVCDPTDGCRYPRITAFYQFAGDSTQLRHVAEDSSGAIVVSGSGSAGATLAGQTHSAGGPMIARIPAGGSGSWIRAVGGSGLNPIATGPAGVIYLAQDFTGTLAFAGVTRSSRSGTRDSAFLAFSSTGDELSITDFGTSGGDETVRGIAVRGSTIALVGSTDGQFGGETAHGGDDAFAGAGLASLGGFYPEQHGGTGNDALNDVALGSDGGYTVVGSYATEADFGAPASLPDVDGSFASLVLARYDPSHDLEWVITAPRYYGEGGNPANVILDDEGNAYFATGFYGLPPDINGFPVPDIAVNFLVARVDSAGNIEWVRPLSANVGRGGISIVPSGELCLAGSYYFSDSDVFGTGEPFATGGENSCIVACLDGSNGAVNWARSIVSATNVHCYDILADGDGVWVVGQFSGPLELDDGAVASSTGSSVDGFLMRIEP